MMSEGTQNLGEQQPVVGEPASHPHQAVVMGEPPEAVDPVLGEPAFANGPQDQQSILPTSAEETSANGVQSASHIPPSSQVSTPVEEIPNLQDVPSAEVSGSGTGETDSRQFELPTAQNPGLSGALVDEASGASDAPVVRSTAAGIPAQSAEEESGADFPDVVEVTHIVDSPSQATSSTAVPPSVNPYAALHEEEDSETAQEENPVGDSVLTDGPPASDISSAPDEISSKGLSDEQDEPSFISAAQDKPPTEHGSSSQTENEDGPLESSKAGSDNVTTRETEQGGQGDVGGQKTDIEESNPGKEDNDFSVSPALEVDQLNENASKGLPPESDTAAGDGSNSLCKEANEWEGSTAGSPTRIKDKVDENHAAPRDLELPSKERDLGESPPIDSCVATRDMAGEDFVVNQPPPAANGSNSYQHGEVGALEREQDLPKVDDDANTDVEKGGFRSKLPLVVAGLAIAAVGVVAVSISRPR